MAFWQNVDTTNDYRKSNNFMGGLNNGNPAYAINDNQCTDGYGWDTDNIPALLTRKGRVPYGSSGVATTRLLTNFGNTHMVRAVGTKLQYDNGGTWTDITGTFTDTDWDATNFEVLGSAALILTNGTDNVKVWNGSSLSDLNAANAPKGKYITNDNVRVFIAKNDIVYYCAFESPSDWTSSENSGSVQYYTERGGSITGLKNYYGDKYIWKSDSFGVIQGTNYFNYKLREISNQIGCVNNKTIQEASNSLFWLGPGAPYDVFIFTGGYPTSIGSIVRSTLSSINTAYLDRCFGGTDGLKYYLGLVTGSNTQPDTLLVYDPRPGYQKWQISSIGGNYRYSALFNNTWYLGDSAGQSYKCNTGTTDNGTLIPWSITSKAFDEGQQEYEKEYFELHIQGYFAAGATLNVQVSTDERSNVFSQIDSYTFTSATSLNENIIVPLDTVDICHWFRYKLTGTGEAQIYNVQRRFRVHPYQY